MPDPFSWREGQTNFKPPKGTRLLQRKQRQKDAADDLDECYRKVDARDHRRCWVTSKRLAPGHVDPWSRLTRHHLAKRSQEKSRIDDEHNVITCSAGVHVLLDGDSILVCDRRGLPTTDVRQIASFEWNRRLVPVTKEPFRLRPVKPRQER